MAAYSIASGLDLVDVGLDAIVVPTNRSMEYLTYALTLAETTAAFLLVLCSGNASATNISNRIISRSVRGLAVDLPANYQHPLFIGFKTSSFPEATWGRIANDISLKRNLGLILGRMAGWSKLLFLDDDITDVQGIDQAISFVTKKPVAGFLVNGFPDNSVVRHAERLGGVEPGVKLTGSALMINLEATTAFFPHVYNEDWFFLYGTDRETFCSAAAGTAKQRPYNPFAKPVRASSEEFGDLLAEGILQLPNAGFNHLRSTESDWRHLIAERRSLIRNIHIQLKNKMRTGQSDAAITSLSAAEARLNNITPSACVSYIVAWSHDLELFRKRFDLVSYREASMAQIVEAIGLKLH